MITHHFMLRNFLLDAQSEVRIGGLDAFINLRYHELARQFPHDVFSVNQATLDFFDTALAHLLGKPMSGDDKDQSVYEMNYRRWIRLHRIKATQK